MQALTDTGTLTRHDFRGEWNYTLKPIPDTPRRPNHSELIPLRAQVGMLRR